MAGRITRLVLMVDVLTVDFLKSVNRVIVIKAGNSTGECVKVVNAIEAAPDCGGPKPRGKAKVSVDVVCEIGPKPQPKDLPNEQ